MFDKVTTVKKTKNSIGKKGSLKIDSGDCDDELNIDDLAEEFSIEDLPPLSPPPSLATTAMINVYRPPASHQGSLEKDPEDFPVDSLLPTPFFSPMIEGNSSSSDQNQYQKSDQETRDVAVTTTERSQALIKENNRDVFPGAYSVPGDTAAPYGSLTAPSFRQISGEAEESKNEEVPASSRSQPYVAEAHAVPDEEERPPIVFGHRVNSSVQEVSHANGCLASWSRVGIYRLIAIGTFFIVVLILVLAIVLVTNNNQSSSPTVTSNVQPNQPTPSNTSTLPVQTTQPAATVAPTPTSATSCFAFDTTCVNDDACCSGKCCNSKCGIYFWNFNCFSDPRGCADTNVPENNYVCEIPNCLPTGSVCNAGNECCSGCCGDDNRCGVFINYYGGDLYGEAWNNNPGCFYGNCYGGLCEPSQYQNTSVSSCLLFDASCSTNDDCCSANCCNGRCGMYFWNFNCFNYSIGCADTMNAPDFIGTCPSTCQPSGAPCDTANGCCSGCCDVDTNRCGVFINYYGGDLLGGKWNNTPGCFYGNCYGGLCE